MTSQKQIQHEKLRYNEFCYKGDYGPAKGKLDRTYKKNVEGDK